MKKIVQEVTGEGLEKLLGERVTLFCANYIYTGVLAGVNELCECNRERDRFDIGGEHCVETADCLHEYPCWQ